MSDDVLKGQWKQAKGEAKVQWGKITDDELDQIEGNTEKLIGKVQEHYGYAKERAAQEVNEFRARWANDTVTP